MDARHKGQFFQDSCRVFARKFFQTQQLGHEQAEEPFSAYVFQRIRSSSDPVKRSMLCGDLSGDSSLELILQPRYHFRVTCNHQVTSA
ncbi:hypothetical protein TNCV_3410601 [Trichonephila clavipes]|nr:hypothetical protein TNCV_4401411 [Trichonephila clavipes]GFX71290.1 hypothetical protein TNCV_3410601 [Trichonephila clavipes]